MNDKIRAKKLRLISQDGRQAGVKLKREALKMAERVDLDLVVIVPNTKPPVTRVMDYGKSESRQQREEKGMKEKREIINVKEIHLSLTTEEHGFQTKLKNGRKLLTRGDRCKVSIRFRGCAITHKEIGQRVLKKCVDEYRGIATIEQKPRMDGRQIFVMLAPTVER